MKYPKYVPLLKGNVLLSCSLCICIFRVCFRKKLCFLSVRIRSSNKVVGAGINNGLIPIKTSWSAATSDLNYQRSENTAV